MSRQKYLDPREGGYVYILALQDGCWYVGHTLDLYDRMRDFFLNGRQTSWTELHKPVRLQVYIPGSMKTKFEVTLDLIQLYGVENVRGSPSALKKRQAPTVSHFTSWFRQADSLDWQTIKYPEPFRRARTLL